VQGCVAQAALSQGGRRYHPHPAPNQAARRSHVAHQRRPQSPLNPCPHPCAHHPCSRAPAPETDSQHAGNWRTHPAPDCNSRSKRAAQRTRGGGGARGCQRPPRHAKRRRQCGAPERHNGGRGRRRGPGAARARQRRGGRAGQLGHTAGGVRAGGGARGRHGMPKTGRRCGAAGRHSGGGGAGGGARGRQGTRRTGRRCEGAGRHDAAVRPDAL